jgi:hypothetical protein
MGFGGPIAGMFHVFFKSLFPFSRNLKLSSASTRILKNIAGYFVAFQNVLVETSALNNPGMHFPVRVADAQVAVPVLVRSSTQVQN